MASTRIVPLLYFEREGMKYVTKHTKKRGIKCNWRKEGKRKEYRKRTR